MRSRRRGRKPTWAYAHSMTMEVADDSINGNQVPGWLLPPGRVRWLCENWKSDHVTHVCTHLWLDFHWICPSGGNNGIRGIPDVYFYAIKSEADQTTGSAVQIAQNPWAVPQFPAAVTDWEDTTDEDGTDSFLWSHRMKGFSPPNSMVIVDNFSNTLPILNATANQGDRIWSDSNDGVNHYLCRTFSTRIEWQPDVVIRARRRMQKDEGIALVMGIKGDTGCSGYLEAWSRTLCR